MPPRITQQTNSPEPSEITESLDLNRIVDPRPHASTENVLPSLPPLAEPVIVRSTLRPPDSRWYAGVSGFIAVNSVDLESISYADGTRWHASNGKTCRVSLGSSVW